LVMTTGICTTPATTHAVSVIPGDVQFSFEVRSQDEATLRRFHTLMRQECQAIEAARGVRFEFDEAIYTAPATMDTTWVERLKRTAVHEGFNHGVMASGAGHDAAVFANAGIPAAMVFIRNENGSHNPHEAMSLDDFMVGVQWLYQAVSETQAST
jgi:beta-ureidopropionase / N-carbamoyl-L-amino-acid hydrolase